MEKARDDSKKRTADWNNTSYGESEYQNPVDRGWSWAICFAGFISYFLTGISIQGLSVLFNEIVNEFQSTYTITSLCLMAFILAFSVLSIMSVSIFVPLFGERKVIISAGVIFSLCSAGFAVSKAIVSFIALSGVQGGAAGTIVVPVIGMLGQYFKDRLSFAISIATSGICVAVITAPPILRTLMKVYGLRGTYLILSGVEFNMVTAGLFFRPVSSYKRRQRSENIDVEPAMVDSPHSSPLMDTFGHNDIKQDKRLAEKLERKRSLKIDKFFSMSSVDKKAATKVSDISLMGKQEQRLGAFLNQSNESGSLQSNNNANEAVPSEESNKAKKDELSYFLEKKIESDEEDYKVDLIRGFYALWARFQFGQVQEDVGEETTQDMNQGKKHSLHASALGETWKRKRSKKSQAGLVEPSGIRKKSTFEVRKKSTLENTKRSNMDVRKRSSMGVEIDPIRRRISKAVMVEAAAAGLERDLMESDSDTKESTRCCCTKIMCSIFSPALLTQKIFLVFLLVVVPGATNQYIQHYLPTIVEFQGLTKDEVAYVLTVCGSVDFCNRLFVGYLADQHVLRPTQLVALSQFCLGVMCHLVQYFRDFQSVLIMTAVMGIFIGTRSALIPLMLVELVGIENMARGLSITSMLNTLSAAVHGPILSYVVQRTGSFRIVLLYVGSSLIASALGILLAPLFVPTVSYSVDSDSDSEATYNVSEPDVVENPPAPKQSETAV